MQGDREAPGDAENGLLHDVSKADLITNGDRRSISGQVIGLRFAGGTRAVFCFFPKTPMKTFSWIMSVGFAVGYLMASPLRWYWLLAKRSNRDHVGKRSDLPGFGLEASLVAGFGLVLIGNLALAIGG